MHLLFHSEIIIQPQPEVVVQMGQAVTLAVVAQGVGKLSYQWFHDSQPLPFGTTQELHLPAAQLAEQGIYTCRVSSEQGSVLSDATTVYGTTGSCRPVLLVFSLLSSVQLQTQWLWLRPSSRAPSHPKVLPPHTNMHTHIPIITVIG